MPIEREDETEVVALCVRFQLGLVFISEELKSVEGVCSLNNREIVYNLAIQSNQR